MESVAAQSYNPQQKSYPLNTLFNPQAASQQAQQSQKDLVSKNDVTQREAIQRDQNYSLATSSKEPSGTLNVYNPNDFNFQGNIKSVGTGIGGFFSSVGGDIKSFFTGRGDETYTNPLSSFENTGGQVGNQKANSIYSSSFGLLPSEDSFNAAKTYFEAKYSGVNYPVNPTNFQMQDIKLGITKAKNPEIANYLTTNPAQTQFNVQQQFNVESNKLEADIQSKINTGALTLDMGKENYATGVSELQTKYNTISSKANSLIDYSPGLYERTGTVFARDATSIALLGASFIPELSPILFNAGAYYGNNEVLSAGIFGAGLGAVGALIKMPTEVKILQREQTLESPILPKSVQLYEKGNEKFYMVTSKQGDMMTTGAEITTKTQFPVFETNEGWKIGEGFGRQTIREYGFNQGSLELGGD